MTTMPIPGSHLPGHARLHERVIAALGRLQEFQWVDFKESAAWDTLKWKLIKTSMAMGNLRDGGVMVIGVSERNGVWSLDGISAVDLATYDVDVVVDQTNSYASTHVDLDIVSVEYGGKTFLTVQANEFDETPIVCKRNGPPESGLAVGEVYVRPPGLARTTRVTDARQMDDLLELAAEKRARRIIEVSQRVGMVARAAPPAQFDQELGGL